MSSDYTQQQTLGELHKAEQLSLQLTVPPAEVPGYRIERLLGQGAFGQVWLGRDLNTGRQVAVKFYLHRGGVNWSLLSREVKHLVNMSTGRHIVQVLGVGWEAEPPYYVMEFLENGSIEDLVRARGALGIAEAVALFREIAEGLNYAHGKGVLHCDLKPANVLLDHDWRPRLADFGQSRMSHEQAPSLGTLFYMAPEQADLAASVDSKWDVYALGAILYTMLVGSPPYRSAEMVEQLDTAGSLPERLKRYRDSIYSSPPPKLHYRRRGADKQLCQIVDQCLSKRPEDRYNNVQQVLQSLQRRDSSKLKRPLYLLGIVGPILLSVLMVMFSIRSTGVAKQDSLAAVHEWSLKSNQFAAMFAARTLESELDKLFRTVEDEASRTDLREDLLALTAAVAPHLSAIAGGDKKPSHTESLTQHAAFKQLEGYLAERIARLKRRGGSAASFNSLFVTDSSGTNVAIAFGDPQETFSQSPVGRNFSFRSYFNGQREDGPESSIQTFQPTTHIHLSGSFRSTSTGKWKVAISAPIWPETGEDEADGAPIKVKPIGVLVLTINLGDFDLLGADEPEGEQSRLAVLVDGRPGAQQGTLLQHPVLKAMELRFQETKEKEAVPQIDAQQLAALQETGLIDYQDPSTSHPAGTDFAGNWVAAIKKVRLPSDSNSGTGNDRASDLWVLVQERTSFVESPVTQLGTRLQREGYIELASVISVVLLMWFFVIRIGRADLTKVVQRESEKPLQYSNLKSTVDH
jgi:eukaryotic-like serine/threonine-protein kinase